jgi:hypothetical protein
MLSVMPLVTRFGSARRCARKDQDARSCFSGSDVRPPVSGCGQLLDRK